MKKNISDFKNLQFNIPLKTKNTMHVGGNAKFYKEPTTTKELVKFIKFCQKNNVKYFVLGNGSNTIVSDKGFDGAVICTKKLKKITYNKKTVCAFAGVNLFVFNNFLKENGLKGLEFSYGIPGTVGGAVSINAGAYGKNMSLFVDKLLVYDGKKLVYLKNKQLEYGYRTSLVKAKGYIVIKAFFKFEKGDKQQIEKEQKEFYNRRKISQPLEFYNSGSIFKCPNGLIAGKIIDNMGLKGVKINGAEVSALHANFIINRGEASCKDVLDLIALLKQKVYETHEVMLETEVVTLGDI